MATFKARCSIDMFIFHFMAVGSFLAEIFLGLAIANSIFDLESRSEVELCEQKSVALGGRDSCGA